jgi:hypothetical protein
MGTDVAGVLFGDDNLQNKHATAVHLLTKFIENL